MERNLPDVGIGPDRAARRVGMMRVAFGDEAMAGDFDDLIEQMTCDAKDRHVLAAAVAGGADTLVTFNMKDFPPRSTAPHQIEVMHPDRFLLGLYGQQPGLVRATIEREIAAFRHPPETVADFLHTLRPTVPKFAERVAQSSQAEHTDTPVPR